MPVITPAATKRPIKGNKVPGSVIEGSNPGIDGMSAFTGIAIKSVPNKPESSFFIKIINKLFTKV